MSSLTTSGTCVKYLLFVFNLLFVITGIIIISVGVSIKGIFSEYEYFLDDKFFSTPNLLIAIGTIIFFIAFFGCCGAVKENFCLTITFSTLLILIFILELAAGISGYVLRDTTADLVAHSLNETMFEYNKPKHMEVTKLWDDMQVNFNCCGIHVASEWEKVNSTEFKLPLSCCIPKVGAFGEASCEVTSDNLRTEGCLDKFGDFIESHAITLGGVGLGFAFIQFLGIVFACHLSKQIRKSYETV